ncbi:hypothetical protein TrVE_jg7923 [Triparma verrucosa]|uniref:EGF-like domain-containing protein n=1 Tax=Triparma verrucosa TaxID=1606542 RepID=A0A9W7CL55_9STRA|nr:hypothetical protein TrVE_jg7923 [Triparma verrucosa]
MTSNLNLTCRFLRLGRMLLRLLVTVVALFPTFGRAATCIDGMAVDPPDNIDGDGNEIFYCRNGGIAGGTPGSCTCTSCNVGFGGLHCEQPACVARDDCIDCDPGWFGPNCASTSSPTPSPTTGPVLFTPNTFEELYNKVSSNGGNSIMKGGDIVELATGEYKCSDAEGYLCKNDVFGTATVLFLENLHGAIKCEIDDASYCVLDGESGWTPESGWTKNRIMTLASTAGLKLTISAITFKDGTAAYGGGMYIYDANVNVDLKFCHFINCKADATAPINSLSPRNGGGAIYVEHNLVTVNVYGSIFTGNTADSGHGGDVFRNPSEYNSEGATAYPVFTFHNTCPSPYSAISPVMLEEGVDVYSYEDLDYNFGYKASWICAPTRSPTLSPTQSPTSSPTTSPTASPVEDEEVPAESDLDGAGVAAFKANVFISLVGAVAGAAAANAFA